VFKIKWESRIEKKPAEIQKALVLLVLVSLFFIDVYFTEPKQNKKHTAPQCTSSCFKCPHLLILRTFLLARIKEHCRNIWGRATRKRMQIVNPRPDFKVHHWPFKEFLNYNNYLGYYECHHFKPDTKV
jgi:hypothetical protein